MQRSLDHSGRAGPSDQRLRATRSEASRPPESRRINEVRSCWSAAVVRVCFAKVWPGVCTPG